MADDADLANDYIANEVTRALGKMRQQDKKINIHSDTCRTCGEKIPDARLKLGFQLCIECAEETERRKSRFADY